MNTFSLKDYSWRLTTLQFNKTVLRHLWRREATKFPLKVLPSLPKEKSCARTGTLLQALTGTLSVV